MWARQAFTRKAAPLAVAATLTACGVSQLRCDPHTHGGSHTHSHAGMPKNYTHEHPNNGQDRAHLRFAVPKKGRLYEQVCKMLEGSGVDFYRQPRLDIAHCGNLPVSIVFLPTADIAAYVGEGDVDMGITGEDIVAESMENVDMILKLGFGKCNLSVLAPKEKHLAAEDLAGKRIVTSFPNLTKEFFSRLEMGTKTSVKEISGSVEAAIGLGLADGIVDLVQTGTTARAAGLEEIAMVMKTQAVLIANPHSKHKDLIEVLRKRMEGYLTAKSWVMITYNVSREKLPEAIAITPGRKSPTVSRLEEEDWVSVSAVVPKKDAHPIMDELQRKAGARDILLMGLTGCRTD